MGKLKTEKPGRPNGACYSMSKDERDKFSSYAKANKMSLPTALMVLLNKSLDKKLNFKEKQDITRLSVELSKELRQLIKAQATKYGVSESEFVRFCINNLI